MSEKERVIQQIREAFGRNEFPGFLQGSFEGREPYDQVQPFESQPDSQSLAPGFLDAYSEATKRLRVMV